MKHETQRLMPEQLNLGSNCSFAMSHVFSVRERGEHLAPTVMGFRIPKWQRGLVWTREQEIRLIESIWRGIPIGTYAYNQVYSNPELDGVLIDGQQRMKAIERYLDGEFKCFGYFWREVTVVDKRSFQNRPFPAYVTATTDEPYLKGYYNMMNFGGTVHSETERAA